MNRTGCDQERPSRESGRVAFLFVGASFSLWAAVACAAPSLPSEVAASVRSLEPQVEVLASSSFLGGAETCFNGLDDNGNTLIDEGCGVAQSEIQFALAWAEPEADLDLYVSDPDGEIAVAEGTTHRGLTLSADCPNEKKTCHGQNYENAYLEESDPEGGRYQVRLRAEKIPVASSSLVATLGVRLPQATIAHRLEFFVEGQEIILWFEVEGVTEKAATSAKAKDSK